MELEQELAYSKSIIGIARQEIDKEVWNSLLPSEEDVSIWSNRLSLRDQNILCACLEEMIQIQSIKTDVWMMINVYLGEVDAYANIQEKLHPNHESEVKKVAWYPIQDRNLEHLSQLVSENRSLIDQARDPEMRREFLDTDLRQKLETNNDKASQFLARLKVAFDDYYKFYLVIEKLRARAETEEPDEE